MAPTSLFQVIADTIPKMPYVLIDMIVKKTGGEKFAKVNVDSSDTAKNIFLTTVSGGYWLYKWNKKYREALKQKDWPNAVRAIQNGAFILKPVKEFFKFLQGGNEDAAAFILTQESDWYQTIMDRYNKINRIQNRDLYLKALRVFVKTLPEDYRKTNCTHHAFLRAVHRENHEVAEILIQDGLDITDITHTYDHHLAFINLNLRKLKFWVQHGLPVNTVEREDRQCSLLWHSVVINDIACAAFLLQKEANTEIAANYVKHPGTPLRAAVDTENLPMIQLLLQYGANPYRTMHGTGQMCGPENNNSSPYQLALTKQNPALVQALVACPASNYRVSGVLSNTIFHKKKQCL